MRTITNIVSERGTRRAALIVLALVVALSSGCAGRTTLTAGSRAGASTAANPAAPWRPLLSPPPPGFVRQSARQRCCPSTTPSATTDAAARDVHRAVFSPGAAELRPPWLWVTISTATGDPLAVLAPMTRATRTTINGADALVDARMPDVISADVRLDADHLLHAKSWGLSAEQLAAALDGVGPAPDGAVALPHPPAGTQPIAALGEPKRDDVPSFGADYLTGGRRHLSVNVTQGDPGALASMLPGVTDPSVGIDAGKIEPVSVQGQPALARLVPTGDGHLDVMVVWSDTPRTRTGQLNGEVADRPELDAALAAIHDIDEATWQDLLRRCPDERAPLELVGSC